MRVFHLHTFLYVLFSIVSVPAACSVECCSLRPQGLQPTRLLCPWNFLGKNTGVVAMSYSRDLPEPEIKPKSLAFRALTGIIFTAVPPGKPTVSTCYFKCESHKEYPLQKQANPNSSFKEDQRIIGVLPLFPCLHSPSPSSLLLCHFFLNYSFYYITPRALKDSLTLYCIYIYIYIYMPYMGHLCARLERQWHPPPVFLPGESQGWGRLVGCCLWGHTESDTTEAT